MCWNAKGWYLEDMEGLELDGSGVVLEQHHHHLQVPAVADVAHHHLHIGPVQQQLAQQLQAPRKSSEASQKATPLMKMLSAPDLAAL